MEANKPKTDRDKDKNKNKLPSNTKVSIVKATQSPTVTHIKSPKIYATTVLPANERVKGTKKKHPSRIKWKKFRKQQKSAIALLCKVFSFFKLLVQ